MPANLVALGVFLGVAGLIVGAYWAFVLRDEQKVIDRLKPHREAAKVVRGVVREEDRYSSVGAIHNALERTTALTTPLKQLLQQSGLRFSVSSFILLSLCLALGGYLLVWFVFRSAIAGLLVGAVLGLVPMFYVQRVRFKRMLKFEEQFPEAIDLVARALRAGHALPTGLGMVADEMRAPVGPEFRTLYDEQNFGLTLPDAMRNFAARIPVLDARFFVTAVLTQREAGGNLAEVLDNLASVIRDRFKVKRQVRVISAHGRITGWVLALLPPSLAVVIFIISPTHIKTLLGDPLGIKMMITAIVLQTVGTLAIRKIVDIEY
jgi:tight adherence protein B